MLILIVSFFLSAKNKINKEEHFRNVTTFIQESTPAHKVQASRQAGAG